MLGTPGITMGYVYVLLAQTLTQESLPRKRKHQATYTFGLGAKPTGEQES